MHSFARHRHSEAGKASAKETKGLIGSGGWHYDTDSYEPCHRCAVSPGRNLRPMRAWCAQTAPVLLLMHLFIPGIIARRSKHSWVSRTFDDSETCPS